MSSATAPMLPAAERKVYPRKLSASTDLMATGAFPQGKNYPQPVVNAVLYTVGCPTYEEIEAVMRPVADKYARMHSVIDKSKWVSCLETLDLRRHIKIEEVNSEDDLESAIEKVKSADLDLSVPWWEVRVFRNNDRDSSKPPHQRRSLIVLRLHHSIGDGIAMVEVFGRIMTDTTGKSQDGSKIIGMNRKEGERPGFWKRTGQFFSFCGTLPKVMSLPTGSFDSSTVFNGSVNARRGGIPYSGERKVVKLPALSLDFIKKLKSKQGNNCTVNDVLLSVFAGGVRRYCKAKGDPMFDTVQQASCCCGGGGGPPSMRALVPVAFPRPAASFNDPEAALRNYWMFVSAKLPVNSCSAVARLQQVTDNMQSIKNSGEAAMSMGVSGVVGGVLSKEMSKDTALQLMSRHSVVFSNVPGPQEHMMCFGKLIDEVGMVYPNAIPQTGIVSYAGKVFFSMCVDPNVVKDAGSFSEYVLEELKLLAKELGVEGNPLA